MKALLAQLESAVADKPSNLAKLRQTVAASQADLVLVGELYLSGYMARDAFASLAEPVDGPAVRMVSKMAEENGTYIVFGMPEKDPDTQRLFNASILCHPDGRVSRYRKVYPATFGPFEEGLYFARGEELALVETKLGKIGLLICYDAFFPELAKAYALAGADLLAIISASPATSKPFFDRILPARAIENTLPVLYANLVGTELNVVFQGGTQAIGPRGEDLGKAPDFHEGSIRVDLDLRDVRPARTLRPTIRDTRPEMWKAIAPKVPVKRQ